LFKYSKLFSLCFGSISAVFILSCSAKTNISNEKKNISDTIQNNSKILQENHSISPNNSWENSFSINRMNAPFSNFSDINFDLQLLRSKKNFLNKHIIIGGNLEFNQFYWKEENKLKNSLYINNIELDIMANFNKWIYVFTSIKPTIDRSPAISAKFDKAFLTIGNLDQNPIYLSVGKLIIPYGEFSGNGPWLNTLTKSSFGPPDSKRQLILGYANNGLNLSMSIFDPNYKKNINFDYTYNIHYGHAINNNTKYDIGGFYLSDIRNLSNSYGDAFNWNILTSKEKVSIGGINTTFQKGKWKIYTEYVQSFTSVQRPSQINLKKNASKTKETAKSWTVAIDYTPTLFGMNTKFQISYSGTKGMEDIPVSTSDIQSVSDGKNLLIASVCYNISSNISTNFELSAIQNYKYKWSYLGALDILFSF